MRLIFTKSGQPLSRLIRYLLNEPTSHFGIVFDNGIVFHSNLLGTHIEWYGSFVKKCEIVYSFDFNLSLEEEEKIYLAILNTYDGKSYDYRGFLYFGYRAMLLKFFGVALPHVNTMGSIDEYLCTELAKCLPDNILPAEIKNQDLGIVSPYQLYLKIKAFLAEKE